MFKKFLSFLLILTLALPLGAAASEQGYMSLVSTTQTSITFSMSVTDLVANKISHWVVEQSEDGVNWSVIQQGTETTPVKTKTITATGLSPDKDFYYKVKLDTTTGQRYYEDNDSYRTASGADETDTITPPEPIIYEGANEGDPQFGQDPNAGYSPDYVQTSSGWLQRLTGQFRTSWTGTATGYTLVVGNDARIGIDGHAVANLKSGETKAVLTVEVWDDDGATGDDKIASYKIAPQLYDQFLVTNVSAFKDGSNNLPEVYIKVFTNYVAVSDYVWWDISQRR